MPRNRPTEPVRKTARRVVVVDIDDDDYDELDATVIAVTPAHLAPMKVTPSVAKRAALGSMARASVVRESLGQSRILDQSRTRVTATTRVAVACAGAVLVAVIAMRVVGSGPLPGPVAADLTVSTAFARERETAQQVHATGIVTTRQELNLTFKVGGIVRDVKVDDGDAVSKGTVLAALDRSEVAAQSRAARDLVAKAQRDYNRVKTLHDQNALPLQVVQDARTQRDQATATLRVAEFNERYATITAPCDGVVTHRYRNASELVQAGAPVIDLACTTDGWLAKINVSDRDRLRIHIGDPAQVQFGAYGSRVFAGTVTGVAAKASTTTGAFEIEVELAETNVQLLGGMVAKVAIEPHVEGTFVAVPMAALVAGNGTQGYVYVLDADRIHVRKMAVEVAFIDDPDVVLSAGLSASTEVVTDGASYLSDGACVTVAQRHVATL